MSKQLIGGRRNGMTIMKELEKQNAELKSDIQQVITESAQVLKASVELIAQNSRFRAALVNYHEVETDYKFHESVTELLKEEPAQSLNIIEAGGIKKALGLAMNLGLNDQYKLANTLTTWLFIHCDELEKQ